MKYDADAVETPISGTDLRPYIFEPEAGEIPAVSFIVPGYRGTVFWHEGDVPLKRAFRAGGLYTATVTLRAVAGCSFAGIPAAPEEGSFSHSRSETVRHAAGSGGTLVITVTFAPPEGPSL